MKEFTSADVVDYGKGYKRIYAEREHLVSSPPGWMRKGLQETASCYGVRLNTGLKIHYNGRLYRLYATCFSNNSTVWFKTRGEKIIVA